MRIRLKVRKGDYMVVESDCVRAVTFIEAAYGNITGIHALKVCTRLASYYVFFDSEEDVLAILSNLNQNGYGDLAPWSESTYEASVIELVDTKIDEDLRGNATPCVIVRRKPGLGAIL